MKHYKNRGNEGNPPKYTCANCSTTTQLEIDPLKDSLKWMQFKCPNCGKSPKEV